MTPARDDDDAIDLDDYNHANTSVAEFTQRQNQRKNIMEHDPQYQMHFNYSMD